MKLFSFGLWLGGFSGGALARLDGQIGLYWLCQLVMCMGIAVFVRRSFRNRGEKHE